MFPTQSDARSFQGSAEQSCFVSLKCQIEGPSSITLWAILVHVFLFQTNVILSNGTLGSLLHVGEKKKMI